MDPYEILKRQRELLRELEAGTSSRRLLQLVSRRIRTSFIGALDRFEHHFGTLWGHGKREVDCTGEELWWRQVWEMCRTEVLNVGNGQIRASESDASEFDVQKTDKTTILKVKEGPKDE